MRYSVTLIAILFVGCIPAGDSVQFGGTTDTGMSELDGAVVNNLADGGFDMPGANDMSVVEDASPSPDMAVEDMSPADMPVDACMGESAQELCQMDSSACGTITTVDSCGAQRTVDCGGCATGAECSQGECIERDCRDNVDNDSDMLEDCADPDCLGRRCAQRPMDRCQPDGSCQR